MDLIIILRYVYGSGEASEVALLEKVCFSVTDLSFPFLWNMFKSYPTAIELQFLSTVFDLENVFKFECF